MSYTLIGEHKKDARANRDGYIAAMTELMENDPTIVHVDCDLGGCINVGNFRRNSPTEYSMPESQSRMLLVLLPVWQQQA